MYFVVGRCFDLIRLGYCGKKFCNFSIIKGCKKDGWFWGKKSITVYSSLDINKNV